MNPPGWSQISHINEASHSCTALASLKNVRYLSPAKADPCAPAHPPHLHTYKLIYIILAGATFLSLLRLATPGGEWLASIM